MEDSWCITVGACNGVWVGMERITSEDLFWSRLVIQLFYTHCQLPIISGSYWLRKLIPTTLPSWHGSHIQNVKHMIHHTYKLNSRRPLWVSDRWTEHLCGNKNMYIFLIAKQQEVEWSQSEHRVICNNVIMLETPCQTLKLKHAGGQDEKGLMFVNVIKNVITY